MKKYDWITALVMMREGKFMLSEGKLTYRVVDNKVQVYSDGAWSDATMGPFRQSLGYTVCENPAPDYIPCTWEQAVAVRFVSTANPAVRFTDDLGGTHHWWAGFSFSKSWTNADRYKWAMKTDIYNEYFAKK